MSQEKIVFRGTIVSVQPRIRLMRSFDQRAHNYLGYKLCVIGEIRDTEQTFTIGIGKSAQAKHEFRVGDIITGECLPVSEPERDPVDYYKVSKLKVTERTLIEEAVGPPWQGPPPLLEVYRERGHRRLAARAYETKCMDCIWGCRMAVEIIVDHWNPSAPKYRFETFCYGPKYCRNYKAGPNRKVPGRKGMVWEEPDWVDEEDTANRRLDE